MACRRTVPTEHVASVKSLYPLGQPEKALGHEPQIDLCVANQATATACQLSGTDQCRRYSIKMQPRWNHAGPAAQSKGRKPKPDGAQNEPGAGSQARSAGLVSLVRVIHARNSGSASTLLQSTSSCA